MTMLVSCLALVDRSGLVLISQRHSGAAIMPNFWEFPGGKVMLSEHPAQAAVRELKEETSAHTVMECLSPVGFTTIIRDNKTIILLLYMAHRWRGPLVHTLDQPMVWVRPQELSRYAMIPDNAPLIHSLQCHLS